MSRQSKRTKTELLQQIVQEYRDSGESWPADSKTLAAWAIRQKKWQPAARGQIKQCASELAAAMRQEYITDPQGRRVRRKHAVPELRELPDGSHEQLFLWHDITDWSREKAQIGFQYLRTQILGDCKRLTTDVDSYNENWNTSDVPIQMCFDFEDDLEEWKHAQEDG